jgi:hypothetical protein
MESIHQPEAVLEFAADPDLVETWRRLAPELDLLGAGQATKSGHTVALLVVSDPDLVSDQVLGRLAEGLAGRVGVRTVELILLPAGPPERLLRQFTYQAAQGSGRAIGLRVLPPEGEDPDWRLEVWSIDSSARELAHRLASPNEPALEALARLLPDSSVRVVECES